MICKPWRDIDILSLHYLGGVCLMYGDEWDL